MTFEYKAITFSKTGNGITILSKQIETINDLGKDGWELVSTDGCERDITYFLKRCHKE